MPGAAKVARDLGIDPRQHKTVASLVAAIDAADQQASPVSDSAHDERAANKIASNAKATADNVFNAVQSASEATPGRKAELLRNDNIPDVAKRFEIAAQSVRAAANDVEKAHAVAPVETKAGADGYGNVPSTESQGRDGSLDVREPQRDDYTKDMFGASLPDTKGRDEPARPTRAGIPRDVQPAATVPGDTPATAGSYFGSQTIVGTTQTRELGAARILTSADLAAATRHLYLSPVERFDGIVTDSDGVPLAVVGGFKGAISQAAVYPATIVAEAVRVPGAANIWFSHNHPSGESNLSSADTKLGETLTDLFRGSGIEPQALIAVSGNRFSGSDNSSGDIPTNAGASRVPVIDRELIPGSSRAVVSNPAEAKGAAKEYYAQAGNVPGLLLMDAQNRLIGWVPIAPSMMGNLRGTGQLHALYRAISESNANAAILAHGGELDAKHPSSTNAQAVSVGQNIAQALMRSCAHALMRIDVRMLDSINVTTNESAASRGIGIGAGPVFSRAPRDSALTPGAAPIGRATLDTVIARVTAKWKGDGQASVVTVGRFDDLPAPILAAAKEQGYDNTSTSERIPGVTYKGKVYLIHENITSKVLAEETLLHERVHQVLRGNAADKGGAQLRSALQSMYARLGGGDGLVRAANEAGVDLKGLRKQASHTSLASRSVLAMEEFLAEIEGRRAYENLPQKTRRLIGEFVGQLRAWLRDNGFTALSKRLGVDLDAATLSDLRWMLRGMREQVPGTGDSAVRFLRVWHGTPHRGIEETGFQLNKIGTGEGAQAYGWGIYFAGKKEVAEWYRSALTRAQEKQTWYRQSGEQVETDTDVIHEVASDMTWEFPDDNLSQHSATAYVEKAMSFMREQEKTRDEALAVAEGDKMLTAAVNLLYDGFRVEYTPPPDGQLYEVNIPEDDVMLLWDKPLSEQSEAVRGAARAASKYLKGMIGEGRTIYASGTIKTIYDIHGADLYRALGKQLGSDEAASKYLNSFGVKGLKYLDGTSRRAGDGSYNYVIWDEALLTPDAAQIMPTFSRGDGRQTPVSAIRDALRNAYGRLALTLENKGIVTLAQSEADAISEAAQARATQNGTGIEAERAKLSRATERQSPDSDLDIKRSESGAIQGFYDPATGKSFLVADNLAPENAAPVLLHEVGIHAAKDGALDDVFQRAQSLLETGKGEFFDRVRARMENASETSAEEAAAYIAEEYERGRLQAPASVKAWIQDFLNSIRAWLHSKGLYGADKLTAGDIAAIARANLKQAAMGNQRTADAGSTGIRPSFAGPQSQTADSLSLSDARARLDAGEDAEAVRQETGWHKGVDGKWRYEISDADAKLAMDRDTAYGYIDSIGGATLGDLLNHPALFAAYPSLAKIPMSLMDGKGASLRTTTVNDGPASHELALGRSLAPGDLLSVLLHEVQHGIQHVEGFATGGSPNGNVAAYQQQMNGELVDMLAQSPKLEQAYEDWAKFQARITSGLEFDAKAAEAAEDVLLAQPNGAKAIDLHASLDGLGDPNSAPSVMRNRYKRLAGEVEARNTQARQRLSAWDRQITPPSQTADVADGDVIVTFNGKEAANAPMPENGRNPETQQAYEARIDALFAGEKAAGPNDGARALDSSDVLGLLGFGNGPVRLAEGKVIKGQDNHPHMTAEVWKKIPQWLDNPAAVFDSDTVAGRLTMIAPELVNGDLVLMAIEPNANGTQVHIMVNAYNKDGGHPPIGRWLREGKGYLVDQKKFPTVLSDSGLQLSSSAWQNKPGMRKILTEKNLAGYRKEQAEGGLPQFSRAQTVQQEPPENTRFDDFVYKMQNKQIDLKRITEWIEKTFGKISDDVNAYQKETLFKGRAAARTQAFANNDVGPLMRFIADSDWTASRRKAASRRLEKKTTAGNAATAKTSAVSNRCNSPAFRAHHSIRKTKYQKAGYL